MDQLGKYICNSMQIHSNERADSPLS